MTTLYLSIVMLCRIVQAIFGKRASNEIKSIPMLIGYSSFKDAISALFAILLILVVGNGFKCGLLTVLIASFSGITLFFAGFCSLYAMKSGTVSLSSMFGTAGMIIPILAGVFLFNQSVSFMQIVSMAVFFVSAWLLVGSSKEIYTNFSFKTMLLLLGSLFSNGGTMLAQQMFTAYVPDGDVSVFSFLSFGIISLLSGIMYLFVKNKTPNNTDVCEKANIKMLAICGVALATAVFLINQLVTICTATVPPVILFTIVNGGGTIISTLVAAILYKEKLTAKCVTGVILGVISFVIIKMF